MPKKEYSFEVVDRCEGLYIQDEKTFEEISKKNKIPIVTLQRWGEKYEWKKKKEEFRTRLLKAQEETRALVREEILLQDLVGQKNILSKYFEGREEFDKGDVNAFNTYINITEAISKLLADIRKRDQAIVGIQKIDRPQVFLEFMRDLVSFLKDRDPDSLSALEKNFDEFVSSAKAKYA